MINEIKQQTEALNNQLKKLEAADDKDYLKELEVYNQMLKESDLSLEAQAASQKRKLTIADKVLAPVVNRVTKQVNKVNRKLIKHNKKRGNK
ncbi:MAG: hypothetical protein LLG05_14055 [Porphyromonadaceae bacterium]|nr:hypothetical protein [Porphyromonadaceae bacterium]